MNIGIGNGKTLLCTSIAIIIALKFNKPVFVVSKNEHLILRDYKKYEDLIVSLSLNTNVSAYS
jgi:preprotein translocase subunit SecA